MKPKKVLVVDDSKLLHRMFEMMLRGFPLVHAFDGREALARTALSTYDVVVLDRDLPGVGTFVYCGSPIVTLAPELVAAIGQ